MDEINAIEPNGYTVASTFSGCGGSSLGYRMAGFKVAYANEFVEMARESYRANAAPYTFLDDRDIRDVTGVDILAKCGGQVDLLDGSPPCSDFSTAGKRDKGWGKVKQYCVDAATPVLCDDLAWRPAGELIEGDGIVAFDEGEPGKRRAFRRAQVTSANRITRPSVTIQTADGATVTCSTDHRWLIKSGNNLRWRKAGDMQAGDVLLSVGRPWEESSSRESGYLAGIFDGEGCVSRQSDGSTRLLGFAQRPGAVLDRAVMALKELEADFGVYANGSGVMHVNINGGPWGKVRLLGQIRPSRLIPKAHLLYEGVSVGTAYKTEVISVDDTGVREVIALSTTAKTFIADGLLSHNSDTEQRVDDLFFEFARLVRQVQPRMFVAENVSGLVKGSAKGYFKLILAALRDCGYRVEAKLLNAAWLGVPQGRQRLIFVGVREDQPFDPVHPKPLPYQYTVREALFGDKDVAVIFDTEGQFTVQDNTDKPVQTITTAASAHLKVFGDPITTDPETGQNLMFTKYKIYDAWKRLPVGGSPKASMFNLVRVSPDKPAPTINAAGGSPGNANIAHWEVPRKFTLGELRRLGGFPDDFILQGTYQQRWERIGRAVPPVMMKAIAATCRDAMLKADGRAVE